MTQPIDNNSEIRVSQSYDVLKFCESLKVE